MEDVVGSKALVNGRHEAFCHEYLLDLNIAQAALRAGFAELSARQQGWVTYNRDDVKDRISFLKEDRMRALNIDSYYVLKALKSNLERCMQAEEVVDKEGNPVLVRDPDGDLKPVYKFEPAAANKAIELLGKHLGMFETKIEAKITVNPIEELIKELSED